MDIRHLDPHAMFIKLFRLTLEYRLKENLFSRVGAWVGYLGGVPGCVPGWGTWVGYLGGCLGGCLGVYLVGMESG